MSNRYYSKDQDIRFRMTTPAEEKELFIKAKAGDEVAREFLIRNHLLFAKTQAESMVKGDLQNDEITSAANWAVMMAYEKFKPHKGYRFTTYLRFWIKKGVRLLWVSKFSGGLLDPSASNSTQVNTFLSTPDSHSRKGKHDGGTFDPTLNIPDESPTVEEIDLKKFNRAELAKALVKLPNQEAHMLVLRYVEDWTLARIGKKFGLTRERIRQINEESLKKLRRSLEAKGVEP